MRLTPTLLIGAAVLALSACGERPQTGDARLKSSDAKASSGTQNGHAAPGWTAGSPAAPGAGWGRVAGISIAITLPA